MSFQSNADQSQLRGEVLEESGQGVPESHRERRFFPLKDRGDTSFSSPGIGKEEDSSQFGKGKGRDLRKFNQATLVKQDVKNPSERTGLIWIKDHNSRSGFKAEVPKTHCKEALAFVFGTICNQQTCKRLKSGLLALMKLGNLIYNNIFLSESLILDSCYWKPLLA